MAAIFLLREPVKGECVVSLECPVALRAERIDVARRLPGGDGHGNSFVTRLEIRILAADGLTKRSFVQVAVLGVLDRLADSFHSDVLLNLVREGVQGLIGRRTKIFLILRLL